MTEAPVTDFVMEAANAKEKQEAELKELSKEELKEYCTNNGLDDTGSKDELVERLMALWP